MKATERGSVLCAHSTLYRRSTDDMIESKALNRGEMDECAEQGTGARDHSSACPYGWHPRAAAQRRFVKPRR